ncbi:hypothetical protein C0993_010600 [Termitomyces sp. T159_Od127]|nr:hypothetical protein C0993_010600 [Termitomyces sp. T159_Od127]
MSVANISTTNHLAETLSLLKYYPRYIPNSKYSHSFQRQLDDSMLPKDTDNFHQDLDIFRMLEATAACLSTTDSSSPVAAAIEGSVSDNGPITLVLARNRNSNNHDQKIAEEFLRIFQSSADFQQALKFLVIHGRDNLNERIRTLRQSFFNELFSSIASHSFKESAGEEFRNRFTTVVLNDRKWGNEPVREILEHLLENIHSVQELDSDVEASHARFVNLVFYTFMLKSSRYMAFIKQLSVDPDVDWYSQLREFWKALDQIASFHRVEKLQKFIQNHAIKVRWANNISYTPIENVVACRPPSSLARQLFMDFLKPNPRFGRPPLPLDVQEERFKVVEDVVEWTAPSGYWDSPAQVQLSLHPEIRIALDPAMTFAPHHLIGCSTSGCMCCTLWLDAYSHLNPSVPRWWLYRFGQEIDVGWAFPGKTTGLSAILPLDQVVLEDVQKELRLRMSEYVDAYSLKYP